MSTLDATRVSSYCQGFVMSRRAESSVDSVTDYNEFYSILSSRSRPV